MELPVKLSLKSQVTQIMKTVQEKNVVSGEGILSLDKLLRFNSTHAVVLYVCTVHLELAKYIRYR